MADKTREEQLGDIGDRIANGIAKGMESLAPARKVSNAQYDPKSPFRSKKGPRLLGEQYDNGYMQREESLTDQEITLSNAITRSGLYVNRLVTVRVDGEGATRKVYISYQNKQVDQRLENMRNWRTWEELLQRILDEQNKIVIAA